MKPPIAAISRAGIYSPNHVGNDAAILHATANRLRRRGCEVRIYSEDQLITGEVEENIILSMCRRPESIEILEKLQDEGGRLIINSGYGIHNCTRRQMAAILLSNGLPYPESIIVDTNANALPRLRELGFGRCWIKKGESHSQHKEDVSFCRHPEEAQELLHEFYYRGIRQAVINRHLEGDLVKFYGIADGSFFYSFYPLEEEPGIIAGKLIEPFPRHSELDKERFKADCLKAAEVTGIKIFGGDAIVDANGRAQLIDFNDWPSFAPCREEAATSIARYILALIKEYSRPSGSRRRSKSAP